MKCPHDETCTVEVSTPAESFLHKQLHREPGEGFGRNAMNLHTLPFCLMPRIARLMQDYHEHCLRVECGEEQLEGWTCSAGFAPRTSSPKEPTAWFCPNKDCGNVAFEPGVCSRCGSDLVA